MRLTIAAVDRIGRGAEAELAAGYIRRLRAALTIREVEVKGRHRDQERRRLEAEKLKSHIPDGAYLIALDERGRTLTSLDFADHLMTVAATHSSEIAFIIGGADGLDPALKAGADLSLSLGAMTWPHLLARALLIEQLYRAETIAAGHPYHRQG